MFFPWLGSSTLPREKQRRSWCEEGRLACFWVGLPTDPPFPSLHHLHMQWLLFSFLFPNSTVFHCRDTVCSNLLIVLWLLAVGLSGKACTSTTRTCSWTKKKSVSNTSYYFFIVSHCSCFTKSAWFVLPQKINMCA